MIGGQITEATIGDHLGGEEERRTLEIIIIEEEEEDISGEVCYIIFHHLRNHSMLITI